MGETSTNIMLLEEFRSLARDRDYSKLEERIVALPRNQRLEDPEIGYYLAVAWLHRRRTEEAIQLSNELAVAAKRAGDESLLWKIELLRSAFLSRQGQLDSAEQLANACVSYAARVKKQMFLAEAYNSLGIILSMRGEWDRAIAELNRALTLFHQLGDRRGAASVNHNLGLANRYFGECGSAENHFSRAFEYYSVDGTSEERVFTESERSLAILGLGDAKLAEAMARRALDGAKRLGNTELIGESLRVVGSIMRVLNYVEEARHFLVAGLQMARMLGSPQLKAEIHEELALLEAESGRTNRAKRHVVIARTYYRRIGAAGFERRLTRRLPTATGLLYS